MKKLTYFIITLALALLLASCSTRIILDEKVYEVDSACENIIIEEAVMNVEVRLDKSIQNIKVTYYEKDDTYYLSNDFSNLTNTYKAQRIQPNKKMSYDFSDDYSTLVLVPENFSGNVTVKTGVGNITLSSFNGDNVDATSHVGNIKLSNINAEEVVLKNSTGNINIDTLNGETLNVKNSTGNITLSNTTINKDIMLENSSGNITGNVVKSESFNAKNSLGNINITKLEIKDYSEIKNATGNVVLSFVGDKDLYNTDLSSGIGDVKGSTTGGDLRIKVETEVGDIKLSYNA